MNFDDAQPIESERITAIRNATLRARDLHFDRKSDYLIKGWLGAEAVSMIYGESNCGKSFLALDIAAHVASGQPWMGHNARKGNVLYLASEGGTKSYGPRIAALRDAKSELQEKGAADDLLLTLIQVDLHGTADIDAISAALPELEFALIVVDTLAMSIGAGSENDSADMAQFIKNIMTLKKRYNCHVLIVHHSGKDRAKGARGHSSLRAAVDTEIEVKVDGAVRTATCKKQRDMENGKRIAFTLRVVDLGLDDEFDPITSCVVEQADIDLASLNKSSPLKGNSLIAKQALVEAIAKHGLRMADTENYPASRNVVEIDLWRSEFLKMRIDSGAQEASVAKDFTRQSKKLQESGAVHSYAGMVWFIHEEDRHDI